MTTLMVGMSDVRGAGITGRAPVPSATDRRAEAPQPVASKAAATTRNRRDEAQQVCMGRGIENGDRCLTNVSAGDGKHGVMIHRHHLSAGEGGQP